MKDLLLLKGKQLLSYVGLGPTKYCTLILTEKHPSFVDMPVWYTHNITNIGDDELITLFWINEFFNPEDPIHILKKYNLLYIHDLL